MKKYLVLSSLFTAIAVFVSIDGSCQYTKWVVQFRNKNNSPYSLSNPSAYLSQRAIQRRQRSGIAIDSTDLPVNPSYVKKVVKKGNIKYLSQSKWLNEAEDYYKKSEKQIEILTKQ